MTMKAVQSFDGGALETKRVAKRQHLAEAKPPAESAEPAMLLHEGADRKLVALLYVLIRDHVPAGKVEAVMRDYVDPLGVDGRPLFSNACLGSYASELAARLK